MQQNLPPDQFAANMYSIYRVQLDLKLYSNDLEKAHLQRELQAYEDYYLRVSPKDALAELGFTPIHPPGGHPQPPAF